MNTKYYGKIQIMSEAKLGVTERQAQVLAFIEDEIGAGRISPNTVEIAKHTTFSTGEVARILDALEHFGCITRIVGRRRNIRLCSPSVKMAPDEYLVAELTRRGYLVRKGRDCRFLSRNKRPLLRREYASPTTAMGRRGYRWLPENEIIVEINCLDVKGLLKNLPMLPSK